MHQAQASSTTSLPSDNCSSLDIKPSIQHNGTSQQSAPKQREGTTTSVSNSGNNNSNSNSNNSSNITTTNNSNQNQNSSLNGGLFDNQNVYGNNAYENSYQNFHQSNVTGFQSGNSGTSNGANIVNMRINLSPPLHSHHHHSSSSSSAANKPQRTKPRTSAGKKTQTQLTIQHQPKKMKKEIIS